ncbi:MAG TPA: alpha-L-fucosidase [Terracidiphilus sp.]|nr:alpha-L-fucosidase [Terracidiphilus sp.]
MPTPRLTRRNLLIGTAQFAAAVTLPASLTSAQQLQPPAQQPDTGSGRAAWMQNPRYAWGVMTHYLADWQTRAHGLEMSIGQWNKMIDGFDVEGMAKRLEQAGAGHYQLSIGQNSGYYLSPNAIYDQITGIAPSKCSHRDLVADFAEPLRKRDIKLMVYLPSGAPGQDHEACAALEWLNGPYPNHSFQQKWQHIIAEWSHRWGSNVVGWWFDGCYFPNSMYRSLEAPNFATFAAAARTGNPNSAIAFNPGVIYRLISISPDEDYIAGEIDHPEQASVHRGHDGLMDGAQIHMLSFLGTQWGHGTPRFSTDQVIEFTKRIRDYGGSVTWDVPVELDGTITDPFMEQLTALGKAFPRTAV